MIETILNPVYLDGLQLIENNKLPNLTTIQRNALILGNLFYGYKIYNTDEKRVEQHLTNHIWYAPEEQTITIYTAGENLVKGNVVYNSGVNTVSKIVVDIPNPIGVVLADASNGTDVYVVTGFNIDVYFIGNTTAGHLARGFLTADGGSYVAGQALSEAVPTSPFASDKHFYEIGHVRTSRVGAGLARVDTHFN